MPFIQMQASDFVVVTNVPDPWHFDPYTG
jgi:hypothetical protein